MYPSTPSSSPSPVPRQNKVMLQRQYRIKEGECFNTLRDVINDLTGEELQTRHEILRKAIDLLLTASHLRKLKEAQSEVVLPTPEYDCTLGVACIEDTTTAHIGHSPGFSLSQWSELEGWQSPVELDAHSAYYVAQAHDQQHHLMFNPTLNQANPRGYGEDWSHRF